MLEKIGHYSLTNPASVYDEEALTALELAGRTAAKVNEAVEAFNNLEKDTDETLDNFEKNMPEVVASDVNKHINNGTFDAQIDKHTTAVTRHILELNEDVDDLDGRVSNLLGSVGVGSTTLDAEVVDLRHGADGKNYANAGDATRAQFNKKVDKTEYYNMALELGNISIDRKGWNYSVDYMSNCRLRTKEGCELTLKPGDVIGMTDYSDARMFIGWRNKKGAYYFNDNKINSNYNSEWLTEDYVVRSEGEYVVLIAHNAENESATRVDTVDTLGKLFFIKKKSGVANLAESADFNISKALDLDLNISLGGMNVSEGVYNSTNRYVTKDILCLNFDVVVKSKDNHRVALHTYENANGDGVNDYGWLTDKGDILIKGGTYFRLMFMTTDYEAEKVLTISSEEQYNHEIYKSIEISPVDGQNINLLNSARTLARIATIPQKDKQFKEHTTPVKIRSINHRGWNQRAPENTLIAYKGSKLKGFKYVECDVRWTSDGVPVLLHDDTVNRTSNGTGRICEMTLADAKALDFGSYKNERFAGEKIPTFEEFITLCRNLELHPYVEIEPDGDNKITDEQAQTLVDIVCKNGLINHVTWISFHLDSLQKIVKIDPTARVGYLIMANNANVENEVKRTVALSTMYNEAFISLDYTSPSLNDYVEACVGKGVPVEVWSVNDETAIKALSPYITGITTDILLADEVIYNDIMEGVTSELYE